MTQKFYRLNNILKKNCIYNLIIGERSNGKTYAILEYGLKNFFHTGEQIAILRRWREDIIGRRAQQYFSAFTSEKIEKMSQGKYNSIWYWNGKFFPCTINEKGEREYNKENVLGYAFSLSEMEHNKSISYPNITTIFFDEFISRNMYLADEFIAFMNTISTIVRQRENVKIFMAGNTINKYCPYFKEMGLKHVQKMTQGTIDVYTYGKSKLRVAVEYCESIAGKKQNNYYFAFENPRLQMIKSGAWELDIFPHLPKKYLPKQILFTFFILFDSNIYQAEIIDYGNSNVIIYIHVKTTELKNIDNDLIYSLEDSEKMNFVKSLKTGFNNLTSKIALLFKLGKVFYQDNDVGNAIQNYLGRC